MCGQDVRGSSHLYRRRPRAPLRSSSPAQQQQLMASAPRLRDPRICAGPDMSDTARKLSRTRFSTFDWTSTIRKPGSIMVLALQTPRCLLPTLAALDSIGERRRLLADDSHRVQRRCIHQLLNRPRSPQQQAADVPGLLLVRVVLHHLEQQRHLKSVMSKRRGRRRPVPMHHQRVLDVQSSSSTADRQNTAGSAHCRKHDIVYLKYVHIENARCRMHTSTSK